MDFLAVPDDLTTEDLEWSVEGIDPDYGTNGEFFQDAATNAVDDEFLEIPGGLPPIVRSQALAATDGALHGLRGGAAAAGLLPRELRVQPGQAPDGIGGNAFETFLSDAAPGGRIGYCEQFASAMAVMARMDGIPARVAVGFLEPDDLGNGDFEYSSCDLHAWPELYFEGAGWVRFEPTPSGRAEVAPDYSTVPVSVPDADGDHERRPTAPPERRLPTDRGEETATVAPEDEAAGDGGGDDEGVDWAVVLLRVALACWCWPCSPLSR